MSDKRMEITLKSMPDFPRTKGNLGKWDHGKLSGKAIDSLPATTKPRSPTSTE